MTGDTAREGGAALPRLKLAAQQSRFTALIGPCYEIELEHGMRRALLLDQRHLNPEGLIHGGVLTAFAEFVLYRSIGDVLGHERCYPCIELNTQFIAGAQAGRWLYGESQILRQTGSLVFAAGELFDQQRRVSLVSAIFKLMDEPLDPF